MRKLKSFDLNLTKQLMYMCRSRYETDIDASDSTHHFLRVITVFTVFRLLTDFVCLYTYEFWLSLCKVARSSVILLLPLLTLTKMYFTCLIQLIDATESFLFLDFVKIYLFWQFLSLKDCPFVSRIIVCHTLSYWMGFEVMFFSISENFILEKLKYIYKYRARVTQWGR